MFQTEEITSAKALRERKKLWHNHRTERRPMCLEYYEKKDYTER